MKAEDLARPLKEESLLFAFGEGLVIEFPYRNKATFVLRMLSKSPLEPGSLTCRVTYMSAERNVLTTSEGQPSFSNLTATDNNAVAVKHFGVATSFTVTLPLIEASGGHSVIVELDRSAGPPLYIRRDTIRLERKDKGDMTSPHSIVSRVSDTEQLRFLAAAAPGQQILSSRSTIGLKGVIMHLEPLSAQGHPVKGRVELAAYLASARMSAIAIPRARRLERPERFNKEVVLPTKTAYLQGYFTPMVDRAYACFDIAALRLNPFRHSIGVPIGIALFDQISLSVHEAALETSREDFMSLMQGE